MLVFNEIMRDVYVSISNAIKADQLPLHEGNRQAYNKRANLRWKVISQLSLNRQRPTCLGS